MSPAAKTLRFVCGLLCIATFLLPIVAMIVHASQVNQAEREWQKELQRMDRTVREAKR